MVNRSEADWFHLDIMDGVFVPNISFGFPVLEKIKDKAKKPLDVHLMIVDPDRISNGSESRRRYHQRPLSKPAPISTGPSMRSETWCKGRCCHSIPHSRLSPERIINDLDMVLLMSVNPGFGGQKFIEPEPSKIERV